MHIVAGKGGVGKSTLTAVLARAAAARGLSVLVLAVESAGPLPRLLGLDAEPGALAEPTVAPAAGLPGAVALQVLSPDRALLEYLEDHGLGGLARRLAKAQTVELVAYGAPGMKDLLVLGKIKQLERAGAAEVILVDGPASGQAIGFLRAPAALAQSARTGPIHHQAVAVLALLADPARCQVLLVATAEETPVNELVETAFALEEEVGVQLGPVAVNALHPARRLPDEDASAEAVAGLDPALAAALVHAARFRRRRQQLQADQLARLAAALPLPQLLLASRPSPELGPADVAVLAAELTDQLAAGLLSPAS
ncbi:MAG: P-loop NTPase [Acidimicrobiales bacterium]